ncbi:MAG: hypothetical protein QM648_01715 [Solirubrobacterales bacterium]
MSERELPSALQQLGESYERVIAEERRRVDRRRTLVRRTCVAVGAVILISVGALVGVNWLGHSSVETTQAVDQLTNAALHAQPLPDGKFAYSKSIVTAGYAAGNGRIRHAQITTKSWLSNSQPGLKQFSISGDRYANGKSSQRSETVDSFSIGDHRYTASELADLADNPEQAVADVRSATQSVRLHERAETQWQLTIAPLRSFAPLLPGSVRAALIESLESIDGVAVPAAAEGSGRQQVEFTTSGLRSVVDFSLDGATLVASRATVAAGARGARAKWPIGSTVEDFRLIASGFTDSAGELPVHSKGD